MSFERRLAGVQKNIQSALEATLAAEKDQVPAQLFNAMHYALLAPGKRLRPYLIFVVAELFDLTPAQVLPIAVSLECVHCYSLIHDDLPCMDDADLRRGLPTVHKQFDEVTALLAGNALLTLAFKVLSQTRDIDIQKRCELTQFLADASGGRGMIGGQMLDLLGEKTSYTLEQIKHMQLLKTGALIEFALIAPAIVADVPESEMQALKHYAANVGLAYQIADDLMDIEATPEQSGKTTGLDEIHGKSTFISLLGINQARRLLDELLNKAKSQIITFAPKEYMLVQFADTIGQH
jgi:farnesyl diphosphate synthase